MHAPRAGLAPASLLLLLTFACGGEGDPPAAPPDEAPPQVPPSLATSAASLAFEGVSGWVDPRPTAFTVSNAGGGALARPAVTSSAPWLVPFVSGGGPEYKVLAEVSSWGLDAGEHHATLTVSSNAPNSPATIPVVLRLSPREDAGVARVELHSGGFMLNWEGDGARVRASAYDAAGRLLRVLPALRSLAPDVLRVEGPDVVRAVGPIGSARIVAEAGGVTSPSIVGIVATPTDGALLLEDGDLREPPSPIDPAAPVEPGWRYRVRVGGTAYFMPGATVLGRGVYPVAGRIAEVYFETESTDFVLEVVPLGELFAGLAVSEVIPLAGPAPAAAPAFTCTPGSGATAVLRRGAFAPPALSLSAAVTGGAADLAVSGGLAADLEVDVSLPAGFDGRVRCEAVVGEVAAALPGALALAVPGRVPYGAGLEVAARTAGPLALTAQVQVDASGRWGARVGGGTAGVYGALAPAPAGGVVPSPSAAPYAAEVRPYAFARLSGGPGDGFDLVEARAGVAAAIDWAPPALQVSDPAYASTWSVAGFGAAAPVDAEATLRHLGLLGTPGALAPAAGAEVPLWRSPAGALHADPPRVAPGGAVTLTVALPGLVAPEGRSPVGRVEILRRVGEALAPVCEILPDAPGQEVFSCTAAFADAAPGTRVDLYAFSVDATGALATEVGPDGAASVAVE